MKFGSFIPVLVREFPSAGRGPELTEAQQAIIQQGGNRLHSHIFAQADETVIVPVANLVLVLRSHAPVDGILEDTVVGKIAVHPLHRDRATLSAGKCHLLAGHVLAPIIFHGQRGRDDNACVGRLEGESAIHALCAENLQGMSVFRITGHTDDASVLVSHHVPVHPQIGHFLHLRQFRKIFTDGACQRGTPFSLSEHAAYIHTTHTLVVRDSVVVLRTVDYLRKHDIASRHSQHDAHEIEQAGHHVAA